MTEPQGVQAFHQLELDAGRFLIQRCGGCGKHVYFPRELCPHCGSARWNGRCRKAAAPSMP